MAAIFSANVYAINKVVLTPTSMGFPSSGVILRATPSGTQSDAGVNLYGIVQTIPTGLKVSGDQYYTVETVAQLKALANA